jgi:hypothetical protein
MVGWWTRRKKDKPMSVKDRLGYTYTVISQFELANDAMDRSDAQAFCHWYRVRFAFHGKPDEEATK